MKGSVCRSLCGIDRAILHFEVNEGGFKPCSKVLISDQSLVLFDLQLALSLKGFFFCGLHHPFGIVNDLETMFLSLLGEQFSLQR